MEIVHNISMHTQKELARYTINNAIKLGKLKRLPCEVCGNPKSEAHHPNYSKPFKIKWVCKLHHVGLHSKEHEAQREIGRQAALKRWGKKID